MSAGAVSAWWRECVTETVKVITVRRNRVLAGVAVGVAVAVPWLFLAAFGWLRDQGVAASSTEVIALAQRNQTIALALMVVLGLQAYISDASSGLLATTLAGGRTWAQPGGKLLFGAMWSAVLAILCTASAMLACIIIGVPEPGTAALGSWSFWAMSAFALTAALLLHFEFGLVLALLARNKGLAVAAGLMVPFVLVGLVRGAVQQVSAGAVGLIDWVLPTELASRLLTWVPDGNSLMDAPVDGLAVRALLLLAWLAAGAVIWLLVMRRRSLYPADQG
ncbi:hypothetical protein [Micropruina sp.]|uniref:hypothetical protein n=1 Tax=Micropruina sp. TaxID=2737536 RepID=UPI0039E216D2